jgi:hypothetical protein
MFKPHLLTKKSEVPRVSKLVTLPMVPYNFVKETEIEGKIFQPGWYAVYVDEKADMHIMHEQIRSDKLRDMHILCISWNIGQMLLTVRQCDNVMSLWGHPVLEPSVYRQVLDNDLMTDKGREIINAKDFGDFPKSYKTVEEALQHV